MIAAVAMVKDEVDIIAATVRRMATEVDYVLVADNGSTDGTRELLDELPCDVLDDPDPAYYQSQKMTRLAQRACANGAEWVVPFDADEVWYSPFGRIADVLADLGHAAIATAAVYDHVPTGTDPAGVDPLASMGWRRMSRVPLPKVACRPSLPVTIHQGNHGAEYETSAVDGLLVVRHFPYRSVDQFVSKVRNGAAAYAATDLPEHQGQHWRDYGRLLEQGGEEAIGDVFREHFWSFDPTSDTTLIFDPCPQ